MDVCVDTCIDICIDVCMDMRVDVCIDVCVEMSTVMYVDVCVDCASTHWKACLDEGFSRRCMRVPHACRNTYLSATALHRRTKLSNILVLAKW